MRVMIFDDSHDDALETSWRLGSKLYKMRGDLDQAKGVTSLDQMLNWLIALPGRIEEVQFWGHGWPGYFWIGDKNFGAQDVNANPLFDLLAEKMDEDSLWWFRTCSTFAGPRGHAMAMAMAEKLGCKIAGHTHKISFWQSGLRTIQPNGSQPSWSAEEGLGEEGGDGHPKQHGSWPWTKNTITCLRGSVPAGW